MNRVFMGIDPGLSGGIAVLDESGVVLSVRKMPPTPTDILTYLEEITSGSEVSPVCYIEKVGTGMPGQSSKATATFARHCGHLDMALLALGIPTNTVTPNKWEKFYQLGKSTSVSKSAWKNILKAKAQQLFPMLGKKITLATCDALLLAEYGRKKEIGK